MYFNDRICYLLCRKMPNFFAGAILTHDAIDVIFSGQIRTAKDPLRRIKNLTENCDVNIILPQSLPSKPRTVFCAKVVSHCAKPRMADLHRPRRLCLKISLRLCVPDNRHVHKHCHNQSRRSAFERSPLSRHRRQPIETDRPDSHH